MTVNSPNQPTQTPEAASAPATHPPAIPQITSPSKPVTQTQQASVHEQLLPPPQVPSHHPPSPQPNLTAAPRPVHANLTSQEKFVNLGSITTSTMSDPINTKNPFSNDFHSSRLYQSLSTPNEQNFRKAILQRTRLVNSIATRNHTQQT